MFVIRLPQLAVLAKILCLLMVVMCGAMPAMVRSVSLYSTCSGDNITVIGRTVQTMTKDEENAPFQLLTTQSEDFSGKLYIYAEKSQRYICFNKRWKPVALLKKQRDSMCQFYESYNGAFFRYRSAVNGNHLLGFNKFGKAIRNQRGRQECYNFLKYNPNMEERLERHNDLVSGRTGGKIVKSSSGSGTGGNGHTRHTTGGSRRETAQHTKKLQHQQASIASHNQHRAKKNLLQADEVPRETLMMSLSHRHRHSNRLKHQPHEDVTSPRRRHHQSRLLKADKY